eukprot:8777742-Pyramimonas_sp.AAC.1
MASPLVIRSFWGVRGGCRYPEQVAYLAICNRPPFFKQVWDMLVPYIDPWVMAKVHVLAEGADTRLQ